GVLPRRVDGAAEGIADVEGGAAAGVAAAGSGLVVLEGAVRDRGPAVILEGPAGAVTDGAEAGAAAGGVGAAEGLVVCEHAAGNETGRIAPILDGTACGSAYHVPVSEQVGTVAAVAGDGPVAGERTLRDAQGRGRVTDPNRSAVGGAANTRRRAAAVA